MERQRTTSPPVKARLRTLGPIALTCADVTAAARVVAQPKRLAMLAYLAARPAGERVGRDGILALFWPELTAARAQAGLRNALYFLRSALGPAAIPGCGAAVWLAPEHVSCDAADLIAATPSQTAASLLELYQGEFLDGLHIADAPDFERWVDRMRAALRSRATELAWSLAAQAESAGEWITAAGYARRAAGLAVDVEGAAQRLIRLLDRAGDRAAALVEFERLKSWLQDEFDVPPSPETVVLIEGVRTRARPAGEQAAGPSGPASRRAPSRSLAVLPFADLTGSSGGLAAGLLDDLLTALATLRGVRIVSRTSVQRFASELPRSMGEVRDLLAVDLVLEGSVRVERGRARIAVQLIDAARDDHLWAETYDRRLTDVFEVQSDVALRIMRALDIELSPRQHRRLRLPPTHSLEAYQLYIQGREVWSHRKPQDAARAAALFERALAIDPDFTLARVGLADAHLVRALTASGARADASRAAKSAIEQALDADPASGEATATLGLVLAFIDWNLPAAERQFARAVELSPGYATAHQWYGQSLAAVGRIDEGVTELDRALELDPLSPAVNEGKGLALYHGHRIDDALVAFRRTLDLDPDYWRATLGLSCCHLTRGDLQSAARDIVRAWAGGAGGGNPAEAAGAEAKLDTDFRPALDYLLALASRRAPDASSIRVLEVQLLVMMGRRDQAIATLGMARDEGSLGFVIVHAPMLDPLARDPRFCSLMQDAGLLLPRWRRGR